MICSDFLSRQKHVDSNAMRSYPFHSTCKVYYKLGIIVLDKGNPVKYLVQTRSQATFSGIKLPEIHGIDNGLDPNAQP